MILTRSEQFDADVEGQFRWYLVEAGLDPIDGDKLANRFAVAVERTLEFLCRYPEAGRPRFGKMRGIGGVRSWALVKPFGRFLVFYRFDGKTVEVERLLEGHRREAGN